LVLFFKVAPDYLASGQSGNGTEKSSDDGTSPVPEKVIQSVTGMLLHMTKTPYSGLAIAHVVGIGLDANA
jgi:hypothetical protein